MYPPLKFSLTGRSDGFMSALARLNKRADSRINKNAANYEARADASPSVDLSYLTWVPIKITYSYAHIPGTRVGLAQR